tara:strand:- start:32 stop:547 length:516 start_codon:yes stop_codon:yes gene_type:complete
MDDSKKIEQLRFVLTRFDHYTEGANSKGNFLLAFCGFLVGFVGSNYSEIIAINNNAYENLTGILLFMILTLGLFSIGFIIIAVSPFLKSNNSSNKKYHSLIFFNSIAQMDEKEFTKEIKKQKENSIVEDLSKQVHIISNGLNSKYSKIGWSLKLLIFQLILIMVIIITKAI